MPIVTAEKGGRSRHSGKGLLAFIAAGAIAAAIAVFAFGHKSPADRGPKTIVQPSAPAGEERVPALASGAVPSLSGEAQPTAAPPSGASSPSVPSGASTTHVPSATVAAKAQELVVADHLCFFTNDVENLLERVSRVSFSALEMPRVSLSEAEIVEFLKRPVDIYDDDDEETVAAKERTAEMKAAALEYISQGGTFNQFLRAHALAATEERAMVEEVRGEMRRILNAEGPEAAQAYLDKANPGLKEAGLKEVRLSPFAVKLWERKRTAAKAK